MVGVAVRHVCRECGSAFNSQELLALHMRLHAGSGDKQQQPMQPPMSTQTGGSGGGGGGNQSAIPGHFLNANLSQGKLGFSF